MRASKLTETLCLAVTAAAAVVIVLTLRGWGPPVDSRLHSEIGRVLATEALNQLPAGGDIMVFTRDTEEFKQPALDILLDRFEREVSRRKDIAVTVKAVTVDPLRPAKVPSGNLLAASRRSQRDKLIVSLLGPPVLTAAERRILATVRPRMIAFCPGTLPATADLDGLLGAGLLQVAIVDRPAMSGAGRADAGGSVGFDGRYVVLRGGPASARQAGPANQ